MAEPRGQLQRPISQNNLQVDFTARQALLSPGMTGFPGYFLELFLTIPQDPQQKSGVRAPSSGNRLATSISFQNDYAFD